MKQISIAIVGTGWCGGIRPERLADVAKATGAKSAVSDYRELLKTGEIEAVYISATPESTHYPIARDWLAAGKHVFLEKPIALELAEADELIALARKSRLKFTIGYSQRFNPKFAYVRKSIRDGTIGKPVSALVSRHITRGLGQKISGRVKLSPAAMECTHDLDFVLWCLEPAKPVRVYSQVNYGAMQMQAPAGSQVPDTQWVMVTMDSGLSLVVGGGWSLPLGYPNFSTTWIEMIGTEEPGYKMSEEWAMLEPGLRVLDDRERMILHLRFFDGLTQSQIAQQVGISQMHVSRLIRRSLEKIREEIGDEEGILEGQRLTDR